MTPEQANQLKDGDPVFVVLDSAMVEVTKFVEIEQDPPGIRVKSDIFKTVSFERAFTEESFAWVYIHDKLKARIADCRDRLVNVRENIARTSHGYKAFALRRKINGQCVQCGKPSREGKVLCAVCAGGNGRVQLIRSVDWKTVDWTKSDEELSDETGTSRMTVRRRRREMKKGQERG